MDMDMVVAGTAEDAEVVGDAGDPGTRRLEEVGIWWRRIRLWSTSSDQ